MKTTHTFGIQFIIRVGKNDKSKGLVYARITVETRWIEISLKKTIAVDDWNKARGIAKGSGPEAKKFNSYLEHVRAQLTDAYRELQIDKQKITLENIKAIFLGDSFDGHSLIELLDYHNTTILDFLKAAKNGYKTENSATTKSIGDFQRISETSQISQQG